MDSGLSQGRSVLAIYVASAVFCLASMIVTSHPVWAVVLSILAITFLELLKHRHSIFSTHEKRAEDTAMAEQDEKEDASA